MNGEEFLDHLHDSRLLEEYSTPWSCTVEEAPLRIHTSLSLWSVSNLSLSLSGSTALVDLSRFFTFLLHTVVRIPWLGDQPFVRLLHPRRTNKHRIKRTDIHASRGIQTHDSSVLSGYDASFLRPHGHCDRLDEQ
jgi:hypothetical protein